MARAAFERARARVAEQLVTQIRARGAAVAALDDAWQLQQFIRDALRDFDERYDYRYSRLLLVFAGLVNDGLLTLDDLADLGEDKRAEIERMVRFAQEG